MIGLPVVGTLSSPDSGGILNREGVKMVEAGGDTGGEGIGEGGGESSSSSSST